VQESAPENEKIKKQILRKIDLLVDKNIVIASSSSGLLPSKIQSKCKCNVTNVTSTHLT
jgi:carnitine 3-dehydrogenase